MNSQSFVFPKLFLIAFFLIFSESGLAKDQEERPDIQTVSIAIDTAKAPAIAQWNQFSRGQFIFLAQMLSFFPENEYYFLARDAEYLYDMARVLLKENPNFRKRLHLLPISTPFKSGFFLSRLEWSQRFLR